MRFTNNNPSFNPVHPQTRSIGPRDLRHVQGRGHHGWKATILKLALQIAFKKTQTKHHMLA